MCWISGIFVDSRVAFSILFIEFWFIKKCFFEKTSTGHLVNYIIKNVDIEKLNFKKIKNKIKLITKTFVINKIFLKTLKLIILFFKKTTINLKKTIVAKTK